MSENTIAEKKEKKLGENVSVNGENIKIYGEKRQFFELTTKKRKKRWSEFLAWKIGDFSGKSETFSARIENFCNHGFTTPQDFEPD